MRIECRERGVGYLALTARRPELLHAEYVGILTLYVAENFGRPVGVVPRTEVEHVVRHHLYAAFGGGGIAVERRIYAYGLETYQQSCHGNKRPPRPEHQPEGEKRQIGYEEDGEKQS